MFLLSCQSNSSVGDDKKQLRILTSYKIQSLAPQEPASYFLIEYGIAETPFFYTDETELKPHLLESYKQIDEKNWQLILRKGIVFQNGKNLTAKEFVDSMNFQIKNSLDTKRVLPNATVKQTGGYELILTTENPNPSVPSALADESGFPIFDVECVEKANGDSNKIIEGGCYTGAYQVQKIDDREMLLTRNSKYWQGLPPLEEVLVKFVPDAQTRILAVQSGEADIALYPPSEAKRMLENQSNAIFKISENAGGGPRLIINVREAPFDETNVRRAVSLGIDYDILANQVFDGIFKTANGFYPPDLSFAIQNQKTDVALAEKLLDESGWEKQPDGVRAKNGKTLTVILLTYPQQPDLVKMATALQGNLSKIGFDVKIKQVDDIRAGMRGKDWNFGVISSGVVTNGGSPDAVLQESFTAKGTSNFGGVTDAELESLIQTLSETFETDKRKELLNKIQQIVIAEKAYEVRLVWNRSRAVVSKKFSKYNPSPRLHHVTFATSE